MRSGARAYIVYSQVSLLIFIAVCVALHPGLVLKWNQAGLSNYGIHLTTVVPYTLALGLAGGFALAAARSLRAPDPTRRHLRGVLNAYGVLMFATLVSTFGYTLNPTLKNVHVTVNILTALFLSEASVWSFTRVLRTRIDAYWLGVQLVGLALALIDYAKVLHVLFSAQVLAGVGFGVLVAHAVRRAS